MTLFLREQEKFMEGKEEGIEEGKEQGREDASKLIKFLLDHHMQDELQRALDDSDYMDALIEKYCTDGK